jgi:hypothetical protein
VAVAGGMSTAGRERDDDQEADQAEGEAARFRRAIHVPAKRMRRRGTELAAPAVEDLDRFVDRADDRPACFDAAFDEEVQPVALVTQRAA